MSDLLGHWAVFDDTRRLAALDPDVEPRFGEILRQRETEARFGAISRGGGWWVYRLLPPVRERLQTNGEADDSNATVETMECRLAYALGGIIHYPADLYVKPLLKKHTSEVITKRMVSAYYDIEVFREVYQSGTVEPFHQFLLTHNTTAPGQALERFIASLFQRALLSSHTLAPPKEDFEGWLDSLFAKTQPLYVDVQLYCRIWENPDPELEEQLEVRSAFYNREDPAIILAREIQLGATPDPSEIAKATAESANQSAYGKAVALALSLLRETSHWWRDPNHPLPSVIQ